MAEPKAPDAANRTPDSFRDARLPPRLAPARFGRFGLWLERLDDALFGPPHTFQDVLALVIVRLEADLPPEGTNRPTS